MGSVTPSRQYEVKVVVPHRPWRRPLLATFILFMMIALTYGSFLYGRYLAVADVGKLQTIRDDLYRRYEEAAEEADQLQQQVANLSLAIEVDRRANEGVRSEVVELESYIAKLEQENIFYRSVMDPYSNNEGLVIDPPTITLRDSLSPYQYNFAIKQVVARHRLVSGYLQVQLLGKQDENIRRIPLKEISESIDKERINLKFKYFQRIKGEMLLPAGFTPEYIELKLVAKSPKKLSIEKKFDWSVQEN
ncbi:MAG: hypothetical protein ACI82Z_000494 [Cellvibrionaceae bacterium]|jgi:hypothetical protein